MFLLDLFLLLSVAVGAGALFLAFRLYKEIEHLPAGSERMLEISGAIREGASSFLREEARHLIPFITIVFVLISVVMGLHSNAMHGLQTGFAFVLGAGCSLLCGFMGMKAATISNVRTAFAASEKRAGDALMIAFNGGGVMGLLVGAAGLIGMAVLFYFFGTPELHEPIIGFGVGASSVALFARIGGGIYTKAADVGSDLVGKVEAGIPEDDPRNPGVVADNVGDNVGDVAGMGADIFESFVSITIGCVALAATLNLNELAMITSFVASGSPEAVAASARDHRIWLMFTALFQGTLGLIASYIAMLMMKVFKDGEPAAALKKATLASVIIYCVLALPFFFVTPVDFQLWFAIVIGALAGIGIGVVSEYFTASKPVFQIVEGSKTGPATNVISGIAVGFHSCAAPIAIIVLATVLAHWVGGVYGSALAGVSMLATVAMTMTIDAYGPIADNAGGISEMSYLGEETRAITDKLDSIGNTTAAIGKGFAIGASALTALSLFYAFAQLILAKKPDADFSIMNSGLVVGAFIGAAIPGIISALTMKSVGKAAGLMVTEIRRQFKEIPGLLEGKPDAKPDVAKCVEISTRAALAEMRLPGIIAIASPILVGVIFGPEALGGFLLGVTLVGVVLGVFMANTGGAWDNAKKFIEQGLVPGEKKGTDAHKAAVVGDTVGDPFKDTSGPSLNILIKLVSVVALLIAPLIAG